MTDEYGNEVDYRVLASKEADGCLYLLAEDEPEDGGDSDVLLFKRVGDSGEEMVFELLDGEHAEFDKAFDLFKDEYDALEIEIEN
ncbi:MAG: DUF1292 domain-containing protein [Clostridiales bacterium]|nr:DUF1292 domain-containing protein [Clostridiales bacterium]